MDRFLLYTFGLLFIGYILGIVFCKNTFSLVSIVGKKLLSRVRTSKIELFIVFIVILSIVCCLVVLKCYSEKSSSVWSSFWVNFFSSFFAGGGITGIAVWLWSNYQRIDAELVITIKSVNESTRGLFLLLDNRGKKSFKKNSVYWHIYVDNDLQLVKKDLNETRIEKIKGKEYKYFQGLLDGPAYVGCRTKLFYLETTNLFSHKEFYYVFSTPYGSLPRGTRITEGTPKILGKYKLIIK